MNQTFRAFSSTILILFLLPSFKWRCMWRGDQWLNFPFSKILNSLNSSIITIFQMFPYDRLLSDCLAFKWTHFQCVSALIKPMCYTTFIPSEISIFLNYLRWLNQNLMTIMPEACNANCCQNFQTLSSARLLLIRIDTRKTGWRLHDSFRKTTYQILILKMNR